MIRFMMMIGIVFSMVVVATGAPITIVDTSPQSGFFGLTNAPTPIATFDFPDAGLLTSLDTIVLTFTAFDGRTSPGQENFGEWTLTLDGINTGIVLNGFPENATLQLTFGPTAPANAAAILAALQLDGTLVARIFDAETFDNNIALSNDFTATLTLNGQGPDPQTSPVPEPASLLAWSLIAGLGLAGYRRRVI